MFFPVLFINGEIKSLSEKITLALSLKASKRERMAELSKKIVSKNNNLKR